jgi:2Fe-2S ferredoxin
MPKVTYIEFNGDAHVLSIEPGLSVMEGAINNNVRGVIAECRGACSCATCHVYVDPEWVGRTGQPGGTEASMLECVCDPRPNSRLACQIKVTEELEGLVVRLPEKQV